MHNTRANSQSQRLLNPMEAARCNPTQRENHARDSMTCSESPVPNQHPVPNQRPGSEPRPQGSGRRGFSRSPSLGSYTTCNRIPTAVLPRLHRLERIIRARRAIPKTNYEANPIRSFVFNKSESGKPISNRGGSYGAAPRPPPRLLNSLFGAAQMQRDATRNCKMGRGCRRCRAVAALAAAARLQQPFAT
jgi:hypothetical protein